MDVAARDRERVLVLAPTSADAALSQSILAEARLTCRVCTDLRELGRELEQGAGVLLLTDEVIERDEAQGLVDALQRQPPWSDIPILLLSASGADSTRSAWAMERLGNITVMERPVRVTTLVSALRTAIRARRRQYELRDQMEAMGLLAAVVESSADAVISKSLDGVITSWNATAERLFGYSAAEAIGQPITLIVPPEREGEERELLERVRRGERLEHYETVRVARDGRLIDISLTVSPIRDATGQIVGASKVARDITARKRAAEQLRQSEARFRFLTEAIPSIVWTAAPDGTITYVNRRWFEYSGMAKDGDASNWPELTLHPDDKERCLTEWNRHLREGRDFEIEVRNRRHDGIYRWFVARAVPFRNEAGQITSWFGITTDIHEQKEMQEALREADRRKDEFLATLAHELRNPLAPIRNALHIMRLKADDRPTVEQARRIMERQLGQMVRLVDDLLDVGRITRGKLELRRERVELAAIIKSAVDTTCPLIEAAGHQLTIESRPEPVNLDADPMRLAQVLSNLLNNAAKYMERGGHIWLTVSRHDSEVRVTVRDKGIGIPADALPTVFDMFAQVERSLERSHGGLGIGLTLAKQLVEMHGGSIAAHSDGPGRGAEFTVTLPIVPATAATEPPRDDKRPGDAAVSYRILVADDNVDAVESMGTMLRLMGNEVRTVRDGLRAVEEAASFRPDLALLDIGMPGLNGYEAARRIREQRWGKDIVLVALTGWGQQEDKRKASEAGFDQHFTKPVNPVDVERLMARLHTQSSQRDHRARAH